MDSPKSTVEYLHHLPLEIWREILLEVYPPMLSAAYSESPSMRIAHTIIKSSNLAQARRAELRLICKRFEPLGLEALFNEIAVRCGKESLERLFDALDSMHRVELPTLRTTGVLIDFDAAGGWRDAQVELSGTLLCRLTQYCPRIKLMLLYAPNTAYHNWPMEWIVGVEKLIIDTVILKSASLLEISNLSPFLDTLALNVDILELHKPVAFPCLTRLCLDVRWTNITVSLLTLPSIRWLSMSIDDSDHADTMAFFGARGQQLDYLELRSYTTDLEAAVRAIMDILSLCPRLDVFEVDGHLVDAAQPRPTLLSTHTLVLNFAKADGVVAAALRWWGFASNGDAPPSVKTVVIQITGHKDLTKDALKHLVLSEITSLSIQSIVTFVVKPIHYGAGQIA